MYKIYLENSFGNLEEVGSHINKEHAEKIGAEILQEWIAENRLLNGFKVMNFCLCDKRLIHYPRRNLNYIDTPGTQK